MNATLAGLAWRDHGSLRAVIAFAGVVVSSMALGNLVATGMWIGLVDDMLKMGRQQIAFTDRIIRDFREKNESGS